MAFDIQAGQRRTVVRCNCLQAADVTARPGTKRFGGVWCSKRNNRWRLAPASSVGCPLYVVAALVADHAHSTFDDFRRILRLLLYRSIFSNNGVSPKPEEARSTIAIVDC
jgi:hypothetical protein